MDERHLFVHCQQRAQHDRDGLEFAVALVGQFVIDGVLAHTLPDVGEGLVGDVAGSALDAAVEGGTRQT